MIPAISLPLIAEQIGLFFQVMWVDANCTLHPCYVLLYYKIRLSKMPALLATHHCEQYVTPVICSNQGFFPC